MAGVAPQGDLIRALDIPMLAAEFTPILADGRHGTGVPYRDEAGRVFYQTFDADGNAVRLLSTVAAGTSLPFAEVASAMAPVAGIVLNAERTMGPWPLRIAAGATLAGTAWLITEGTDGIFTREALSHEGLSEGRAPLINVPVNPGPGGTPGFVSDNPDTSIPGYQTPDIVSTAREEYPAEQMRPSDLIVENRGTGESNVVPAETSLSGPRIVSSHGPVDLREFERLNVSDPDVGRLRPGEAGVATELQNYFGGRLGRSPEGVSGDFVILSGPLTGKTVDLMLTPSTALQAERINQFFERNLEGFASTLELHLQKADFVPMDTRFLTGHNKQVLEGLVNSLPTEQQNKTIFIR